MTYAPLLLVFVLLSASAPLTAGGETITITLQVNLGTSTAPMLAECMVTVPEDANAGDVLDQARDDGCIQEWSYSTSPGFGRYVTSIDYVHDAVITFWAFRVNGGFSDSGIDSTFPLEGDVLTFTYEEWPVPL